MSTRIISWEQVVLEADPDYRLRKRRPMKYEFSNGRRFYDTDPVYIGVGVSDDLGIGIMDDQGVGIDLT